MNRLFVFALFFAVTATCTAQGIGGIAEVAIVDRDSGALLSPHFYRGEYWVAGRPGGRYAIEIRNRLGERLLAVTSVDGVNVISGETAGWDQTGYVFGPGQRYQITGWRKSDAEVAAFTFTDSPNSYAGRTGRPGNVGIIGVAVFRERPPELVYSPPTIGQSMGQPPTPRASDGSSDKAAGAPNSAAAESRVAPAAPAPLTPNIASAVPAPKLGTGHGEREYAYVNHTEFARLQIQPNEVIRIHYDSFENLLAMGVVKRPRPVDLTVNPFPASPAQQYVPDPPG